MFFFAWLHYVRVCHSARMPARLAQRASLALAGAEAARTAIDWCVGYVVADSLFLDWHADVRKTYARMYACPQVYTYVRAYQRT